MIEKVNWDSAFFAFSVGRTFVNDPSVFDLDTFLQLAENYRLVYIFSASPLADTQTLKLVDVKLTFQKKINHSFPSNWTFFQEVEHNRNKLQQLAFESGIYSRFRTDLNFDERCFYSMYEIWIQKSIKSKLSAVLIEQFNNELVGFVTVDFAEGSNIASIGLIAVSQECRGQGVGGKLLRQAESLAASHHCNILRVATQKQNEKASAFYLRNGFELAEQLYIYHYWNL